MAFWVSVPFGLPANSRPSSSRCAAAESSTSCVSVSFFGDMIGISVRLPTASRAVTTEAPHWRQRRRGRIPGGPTALRQAATVTLCLRRKASHFWPMLLPAFRTSRSCNDCGSRCGTRCLRPVPEKISAEKCSLNRHEIPARSQRIWPIVAEMRRFESFRPSQPQRRGIEYGLAEHDVAAIIEVIREISSQEKGKSKTRRSA
jgi:hypothetical protein